MRIRVTLALVLLGAFGAAASDIADQVRAAAGAHQFAVAEAMLASFKRSAGITAEYLAAESWLARGELDAKQYDQADKHATEAERLSAELLHKTPAPLPGMDIALGAAIEVHAQVLAVRGQRMDAVMYLKNELAAYRQTPIAARIQKNINLLTLVGKPAPELDESRWLGPKPRTLADLKGHPVLLFFWAHWCGDCKAEVPVLARLMSTYGPRGLVVMAPTQHYGYAAEGVDASPQEETQYIEQVRARYYAALDGVTVPLAEKNFLKYGCSTTPTLVLVDKGGIVRFYHPGALSYQALADQITAVLSPPAPHS